MDTGITEIVPPECAAYVVECLNTPAVPENDHRSFGPNPTGPIASYFRHSGADVQRIVVDGDKVLAALTVTGEDDFVLPQYSTVQAATEIASAFEGVFVRLVRGAEDIVVHVQNLSREMVFLLPLKEGGVRVCHVVPPKTAFTLE